MSNIYWESFKKADNKNEFLINLAEDFKSFFGDEGTYIKIDYDENCGESFISKYFNLDEGTEFLFPELMKTVTYDEEEGILILDNEEEISYDTALICFQTIYDGPMMILEEGSSNEFFELVFNKSLCNFIGNVKNKVTEIEFEGIKAKYYNVTREEDGIEFSGVLFI